MPIRPWRSTSSGGSRSQRRTSRGPHASPARLPTQRKPKATHGFAASRCWARPRGCSPSASSRRPGNSFPRVSSCSRSVRDLVNLPIALAAGAALAAQLGDPMRAGTLWGAAEAEAERTPRETTTRSLTEYEPYLEPVRGDAFEEARRRDARSRSRTPSPTRSVRRLGP